MATLASRGAALAAFLLLILAHSACSPASPSTGGGGNAGDGQPAPTGSGGAGDGGATIGGAPDGSGASLSGGAGQSIDSAGGGGDGVGGGGGGGGGFGGGALPPPTPPPTAPPTAPPVTPPADGRWAGLAAPFFAAADQDDRLVALDSLAGRWVVLYFYPKDDTPGCTVEGREFTDLLPRFSEAGAVVFGVSADSTESHRAFREKCSLQVDLLSDPAREMMARYGAWIPPSDEGGRGRLVRCTFLIDPEGRVAHHWPAVNPAGHAAEVLAKLNELRGG